MRPMGSRRCSTGSAWRRAPARWYRCSGAMARASPPRSSPSWGWWRSRAAASGSPSGRSRGCRPTGSPRSASAMCPKTAEMARRRGGSLSGGEQQMLTVARTLMGNPRLLLLDEPSEGLAPVIVKALAAQIAALKHEGLTILLSEQNLKFAARLADRAYIIEKGQIRFEGPMQKLLAEESIRRAYLTV